MQNLEILDHWRDWQRAQKLSERTISSREQTITHLVELTGADPLKITPDEIMAFVGRRSITATTASTYHASIRAYCAWLVKTDRRLDDPSMKTPSPKRPAAKARPLPTGNVAVLLGASRFRRTRMMILLATMAGLRVHEVAKFHGSDLDRNLGAITVTGKGGSTQIIPAHESVLAAAVHFPDDDYWFAAHPAQKGQLPHVTRQAVYAAIKGAMRRAKINGTPHQLRHWYGTALLDEGVDIRIVQELMRHKTIATTQLYTHVHWRQMQAAMGLLRLPAVA
jgi:integrase/recombinase XerD